MVGVLRRGGAWQTDARACARVLPSPFVVVMVVAGGGEERREGAVRGVAVGHCRNTVETTPKVFLVDSSFDQNFSPV